MAANVETMMWVREKPWHGLGTGVQEAQDSKSAIKLAEMDWQVNKMPIYDANGREIAGFKANTRDKDNSVLGIVTDRYQVVQNSEAFEFTDFMLGEGVKYETCGSLRNGKQIWLLARMPDTTVLGEKVEPYMCFTNSHDGTGAIKVCLTPVRVVCNNTLNMALSGAKRSWSTRHVGDLQGKLAEAKEALGMAEKYMQILDEEADKMANTKISDGEIESIVTFLFPIDYVKDSARKIQNSEEMRNKFMMCYMMPDLIPYRNTQYGVVNAAADMAAHMAPSRASSTYASNNWGRIMDGHPLLDNTYSRLVA